MAGTYLAGQHLPSERALAEAFAVNRQVVREASRRLAQMGLVQVLHGDGTRVLDYRAHGGLDLLALMIERQTSSKRSLSYWMPILELRSALAPDVVRHCTKRGKQALRDELLTIAVAMSQAGDIDALYELEVRFWDLVHEGADHLVYRFTYNSFKRCAASIREQSKKFTALEVKQCGYRIELAKAMAAGDAARAEREIRSSMRTMLDGCEAELARRSGAGKATSSRAPSGAVVSKAKSKVKPGRTKAKPEAQLVLIAKPPPKKKASIL
ncbi:MAG: regulatory protein GntR [Myxococcaceae bacterium]|nr:regulatory protein GntR [Myxococcaceae bacterium]